MKKILLSMLLVLGLVLAREVVVVSASEDYSSGGKIENTTIQVTENNMFNITSGTLEINNVKFEGSIDDAITKIITVGEDATLILNDVDFSSLVGSCAIIVNGTMIANNVNFGTRFTNAITLNSTKDNPCVLGGEILLNKIYIDNGYMTLNEDANMLMTATIDLENPFIGKRVVTGDNTFASYYLDKFCFSNGYDEYVLDYVGYDYDEYSEDKKSSDTLTAGDIISTQSYANYKDGGTIYLGNKYCTGVSYISENNCSGVVTASGYTNFHLNNINCLMASNFLKPSEILDTNVTANIKVMCDGSQVCDTIQEKFYNDTDWNVFVDIPEGYEFESVADSVDGDNVSVVCNFTNSKFAKCVISTNSANSTYTFDVIVNVKEKVSTTYVDILLESDSDIYSSENLISTIKPYYEIDSVKYYVDFELSLDGENVTEALNVGDYTITITSTPENIYFNNLQLNFSITPCELTVEYSNISHRYDGSEKSLSAKVNGVLGEDVVNLTLENNCGTNVGSYIVTSKIDNDNYILSEGSRSCTLVISKGIYDVSNISASTLQFEYTKDVINFQLNTDNIPSFIDYSFDIDECILPGDYDVEVTFTITENDCYDEVSLSCRIFRITISKVSINIGDYVTICDESFTYDFSYHSLTLVGDLPQDIAIEKIDHEREINIGRYDVVYYFTSPTGVYDNLSPLSAVMNISPAKIEITLEERSYIYTGNDVIPTISYSGICTGDSCIVTPVGNINVGEYTLNVTLSNTNYYVDTTNIKYSITPKSVSLSGITLSKSEIVYSGTSYIPEIVGDIPSEITKFDLVYSDIKNVGTYEVTADIEVGSNYAIDEWTKTIKVLPKSITITFSGYDDLYYTGSVKSVHITLNNLVDTNFDKYLVTYSNTPIEVGNYICTVSLMDNTNYVIVGNDPISFKIYPNEKVVTNEDMSITVQGRNGNISDLVVTCSSKDSDVENSLKTLSAKINGYNVINFNGVDEEVSVSIITNLNVKNKDRIKVFKLNNGNLIEVDFILNNKIISFDGDSNFQYVIIEEGNNSPFVIIISILSGVVVALSIVVYLLLRKKRLKSK